jgi:hypothetical protein
MLLQATSVSITARFKAMAYGGACKWGIPPDGNFMLF